MTDDPRPFTPERYDALVRAALDAGYRFARFGDAQPADGDLLLRHDVDLSLDAAVAMAEIETGLGASSTYFVMTQSPFYNLDSAVGRDAVERLRALGHRVAYHGVWPNAAVDRRFGFDPLLAWHNPDPGYMTRPVAGADNAMDPRFTGEGFANYRSDSNMRWRHGDVLPDLRRRRFAWLQLLIHPELWMFPGETLRDKLLAMLDADRTARLEIMRHERLDID